MMFHKSFWVMSGGVLLFQTALASTDYAPAIWRPPGCSKWNTSGNGHHFCVIHDMEGYYWTSISYLNRCDLKADGSYAVAGSVHFCVNGLQNGSDEDGHRENNSTDPAAGEITQSVRESYYAWHARCWNSWSWGTEHEGFASSPAWYTEPMYVASAGLQRHLMLQTGHPLDRNHIIAHGEKSNAAWVAWMKSNYPSVDTTCNTHTDPGSYWNWSHFMALVTGAPSAPSNLAASPLSPTQIKLTWTDNSTNETGFKIERATASAGPFAQIGTTTTNIAAFTNSSLTASTVYYYRVRSYNSSGDSSYSNVRGATTGNSAPVLIAIGNKTVTEASPLTFTATATDPGRGSATLITDFESYSSGTASVMFQKPGYSGSTSALVDTTATNYTMVTTSFPSGHAGSSVLKSSWTFATGKPAPWIRLTTVSAVGYPNPVIDVRQVLKFDFYTDKAMRVGLGVRETTTAAGTTLGSDGGTSGSIEWVGVTSSANNAPFPTRTISPGTWQTLYFNLPRDPAIGFTGNGVLSTASGLGVLEHIALVPTITTGGTYTVYFDNFSVVYSNTFSFSLDAGAPAGASIDPFTGVFTWTPTEAQGPEEFDITVRVTDIGTPPLDDFETITVLVEETNNAAPALAAISDKLLFSGDTLVFTNSATDVDLPLLLTYSLEPGAPAEATIEPLTGVFRWTAPSDAPDSTNTITVRVSDDGPPVYSATRSFTTRVVSRNAKVSGLDAAGNFSISWSTVPGKTYRIQYKDSLAEPVWIDASSDILASGTTLSQTYSVSASGQRFYRIVQIQ